jgi:hypothetical protein
MKDHVEDLGVVDCRILLKCVLRIGCEGVDKGAVAGCC